MIDLTQPNDPANLRRMAALLLATADGAVTLVAPSVPAGTVVAPVAPALPAAPSPPVEVMKADAGHASEARDPAQVFGGAAPAAPPVPPVVVTAPAADVASTITAPSPSAELDGAGLPWDQRIHSTPAKKNANGLWRMRRAVDPNLIQTVEAELRLAYPAKPVTVVNVGQTTLTLAPVGAPPVPVPPGASATVPLPPTAPVAGVPVPPVPVTLPGVAAPGIPPSVPAAPGLQTGADAFRLMMDKFSKEMGPNGKLNKAAMGPLFAQLGIGGWGDLHKRADLIPAVVAEAERLTTVAA